MRYTKDDLLDLINWEHRYAYRLQDRKKILSELLPRLKSNKLTDMEYVFVAQSFFNEILHFGGMAEDEGDYGDEFIDNFSNEAIKLSEDVIDEYYDTVVSDPGAVKDLAIDYRSVAETMVLIYKEAKQWMIKKGYEV